jgi:hypothetical protein
MANVDSPFGLKPLEYLNGSPWNGQARRYYIASGLNETIYIGDPVVLAGSADAEGKYATVKLATLSATNITIGPVVAFEPDPTNLNKTYHVAQTAQYCWVADDPNIIFEVQMDSATTLEADDVGSNGILVTGSGSTVTGRSGYEADESSFSGADATEMLLLLGIVDREDNELGQHCKAKVLISRQVHQYGAGLGA